MAVTVLQAAIDNRYDPMQGTIIQMYDKFSKVLDDMPMDENEGRYYDYERMAVMPSVGWRAFNQAWTESSAQTTPFREHGKVLGGEVKIDVQLLRTARDGGRKTKKIQTEAKMLASALEWDRSFFEGSELNDADEMVGLRARLAGNQLINAGTGGATLTLAMVYELLAAVPFGRDTWQGAKRGEGVKKVLYMNTYLRRKLTSLVEAQTGSIRIERTENQFGIPVEMIGGAEIKVVEEVGTGVTMLDFDEDDGSGNADTASMYCVAYGDRLVHGFYARQPNGPIFGTKVVDEMESEPRWMLRTEAYVGMAIDHPRAAARLNHINRA